MHQPESAHGHASAIEGCGLVSIDPIMGGRGPLDLRAGAGRAPAEFIDAELREMVQVRLARTASRSVVGIMNEFAYLADAWRHDEPDLLTLAVRLAATPCGPLYKRHISPDRELAALVAARARPPR